MAISSNSLFHYTTSLNTIKGIIKNGFMVSYCVEALSVIPMISFCDIPLGQAKYHLENYGNYAIGMKTEWGIKNGLNPVLYLENNSYITELYANGLNTATGLSQKIRKLIDSVHIEESLKDELIEDAINSIKIIVDMLRFSKPYSSTLIRGENIVEENYKFYNEREWRYVPLFGSKNVSIVHQPKICDFVKC